MKISTTDANNDASRIIRYRAGDQKAFSELVNAHLSAVYSFVARYVGYGGEAEDIVQEVFVKVWKNLGRFDTSRNFRTWLFTIAKNTALDWLKKKRPVAFSELDDGQGGTSFEETVVADESPASERFDERLTKEKLTAGLDSLPPEYRAVVLLRLDSQLTFREIAETLNKSANTVKSHYRRAVALLRRFMEGRR